MCRLASTQLHPPMVRNFPLSSFRADNSSISIRMIRKLEPFDVAFIKYNAVVALVFFNFGLELRWLTKFLVLIAEWHGSCCRELLIN